MAVPVHMHNGFPTGKMEQTIMMSLCDVMRISYATKGGNYEKESTTELGVDCYCLGVLVQSIWVC